MHSWTLLAANTIMLGCVSGLAAAMWFFNRRVVGLPAWTVAFSCAFLGSLNYLFRPYLPPNLAFASIAALSIATAYFNLHACRVHLGLPVCRMRTAVLLIVATGVLFGGSDLLQSNLPLRFSVFSFSSGGLFVYAGWLLTRNERSQHPARYIFGLVCVLHGFLLCARPVALFWNADLSAAFPQMLDRAQPAIIESLVAMQLLFFSVLMLVNEHLNASLRRLAQIDSLTDVYNRRAFLELLDKAASLAQRHHTVVPLLLIDLDHFKNINDTHGHLQGDQALRHFVGVVNDLIRREDILGRLGGEEFAVFLPKTDLAQACAMAERLRGAVANAVMDINGVPVRLTVSIGVTACHNRADIEAAIHRADAAMYRAKEQGRNRVEAAPVAV